MDAKPADAEAVARMWEDYVNGSGYDGELVESFAFGDSAELADELAALVATGPKRATTGLLVEFERDQEPLPSVDDRCIVLDGSGLPVAVVRTTEVEVKPVSQVDASYAWDEGEGDRSLEYWIRAHRRFFTRRCEQMGVAYSDQLEAVFERFELVWPLREPP